MSADKPRVRFEAATGGRPAYQRALSQEDQRRVELLEQALAKFDRQFALFVQDARFVGADVQRSAAQRLPLRAHLRGSRCLPAACRSCPSFTVPITPETTHDDLQSAVKLKLDLPIETEDLTLVYEGTRLRPDMSMADLGLAATRRRWSKPYAGVLWVVPRHVEPSFIVGDFSVKW